MRRRQRHPTNPRFQDISGHEYGSLTVIFYVGQKLLNGKKRNALWRAKCACGKHVERPSPWLKKSQSCGCHQRLALSIRRTTHGHTKSGVKKHPLYNTWNSMVRRCRDRNTEGFEHYGGRGIKVCNRWSMGENGLSAFACFLSDMGDRPSPDHSIDRWPNNNGNYEPSNCRWATQKQQQRNRRSNRIVSFKGVMVPLTVAAELAGINPNTVWCRLKLGWSMDDAINRPVMR